MTRRGAFSVILSDRPARPADTPPETLAWIERIEELRASQGIDSSAGDTWATFASPLPAVLPSSLRLLQGWPCCLWCDRRLTGMQVKHHNRYCSLSCSSFAKAARRRSA
jgi:hypothetical protein